MTLSIWPNPQNYTTRLVKPNVNHGLYLIIMHLYWFINYNNCTIKMQDVNNRRNWGRGRVHGKPLYSLPNFSVNYKCSKKKISLFFFEREKRGLPRARVVFFLTQSGAHIHPKWGSSSPAMGLELMNCEIMTQAEVNHN